ncbi:hypothetical protein, partial [Ethanoligenens sp.]|uniref:hypothetical protein n=1 Tax=Ethanoligenens sp. TaxID=2099655 RepID=UPI0039E814A4
YYKYITKNKYIIIILHKCKIDIMKAIDECADFILFVYYIHSPKDPAAFHGKVKNQSRGDCIDEMGLVRHDFVISSSGDSKWKNWGRITGCNQRGAGCDSALYHTFGCDLFVEWVDEDCGVGGNHTSTG